jgi:hypothetical protein
MKVRKEIGTGNAGIKSVIVHSKIRLNLNESLKNLA